MGFFRQFSVIAGTRGTNFRKEGTEPQRRGGKKNPSRLALLATIPRENKLKTGDWREVSILKQFSWVLPFSTSPSHQYCPLIDAPRGPYELDLVESRFLYDTE